MRESRFPAANFRKGLDSTSGSPWVNFMGTVHKLKISQVGPPREESSLKIGNGKNGVSEKIVIQDFKSDSGKNSEMDSLALQIKKSKHLVISMRGNESVIDGKVFSANSYLSEDGSHREVNKSQKRKSSLGPIELPKRSSPMSKFATMVARQVTPSPESFTERYRPPNRFGSVIARTPNLPKLRQGGNTTRNLNHESVSQISVITKDSASKYQQNQVIRSETLLDMEENINSQKIFTGDFITLEHQAALFSLDRTMNKTLARESYAPPTSTNEVSFRNLNTTNPPQKPDPKNQKNDSGYFLRGGQRLSNKKFTAKRNQRYPKTTDFTDSVGESDFTENQNSRQESPLPGNRI